MSELIKTVKTLCREIEKVAGDVEREDSNGDHATQVANYAAANAMRQIASVIGYTLIGTEDFRETDAND